jgi:chemotaxis protein CheX
MTAPANAYALPESLGAAAAPGLAEALRGLRGAALTLQAGGVRRMGAQAVQVLLSAAATWRADGGHLTIQEPSAEFREALRLLGLSVDSVTVGDRAA